MDTIVNALRNILGSPNFYRQLNPNQQGYSWDYAGMIEYLIAGIILIVVVSYVFRIIMTWINGRR